MVEKFAKVGPPWLHHGGPLESRISTNTGPISTIRIAKPFSRHALDVDGAIAVVERGSQPSRLRFSPLHCCTMVVPLRRPFLGQYWSDFDASTCYGRRRILASHCKRRDEKITTTERERRDFVQRERPSPWPSEISQRPRLRQFASDSGDGGLVGFVSLSTIDRCVQSWQTDKNSTRADQNIAAFPFDGCFVLLFCCCCCCCHRHTPLGPLHGWLLSPPVPRR